MDNPDLALPFSVRHNEQPVRGGNTQAKKTGFAFRMIGVWNRDLERSANTVVASGKPTSCLLRFSAALSGSHSNFTLRVYGVTLVDANVGDDP